MEGINLAVSLNCELQNPDKSMKATFFGNFSTNKVLMKKKQRSKSSLPNENSFTDRKCPIKILMHEIKIMDTMKLDSKERMESSLKSIFGLIGLSELGFLAETQI